MTAAFIFFIIVSIWFFYTAYTLGKAKITNERELEIRFLLGVAHIQQLKYQALAILHIVYEKAGETDPKFIEEYDKIVFTTEKKFDEIGDKWVQDLQKVFSYQTKYQNWREATRYINELLSKSKNDGSGKGN